MVTAVAVKAAVPAVRHMQEKKEADAASSTTREVTYLKPVTVTINAEEFLAESDYTLLPAAVTEAVEAFRESQEPYDELGVPLDVSYDVPELGIAYVSPIAAATSSGFGYRMHPLEGMTKFHYGTDLAANSGDDIVSFADGTVTETGEDEESGQYITIRHENGCETKYAHCSVIYVSEGQAVHAGEKIALVGATGQVTGPHLHFELSKDGTYLNPEFYLAAL